MVLAGPIANQVGTAFGIGHAAVLIWDIAKWPVLVIIVSVMYSLLCKASPNVRQPAFRWISAGGILAVIIWLIASGLFAVYVSFVGSYKQDLRIARHRDHLPGLVVDLQHRDPARG